MKIGKRMVCGVAVASALVFGIVMVGGVSSAQADAARGAQEGARSAKLNKKASSSSPVSGYAAHEWGTFTMVADPEGRNVPWYVAGGPVDLPEFVYPRRDNKFWMPGKMGYAAVRMETPVIYFYTDVERTVTVDVAFPGGKISEWYPHAGHVRHVDPDGLQTNGPFRWARVKLDPQADWQGPTATDDNHYFEARGVGSVPVEVRKKVYGDAKTDVEREEFLFYRGLRYGPIQSLHTAVDQAGVVTLAPHGAHAPKSAIVFKNEAGVMRWQKLSVGPGFTRAKPADWAVADRIPEKELHGVLTTSGLSLPEANAMLDTWKRDWFEPGLRVFYLIPQKLADELLPLTISPKPDSVVRSFVNRVDLLSPQDLDFVERIVDAEPSKEAWEKIHARFGRYSIAAIGAAHTRRERSKDEAKKFHAVSNHPLLVQVMRQSADVKVKAEPSGG